MTTCLLVINQQSTIHINIPFTSHIHIAAVWHQRGVLQALQLCFCCRSHSSEATQPLSQSHPDSSTPGELELQHMAAGPLLNSKQAGAPQTGKKRSLPPLQPKENGTQSLWQQQPSGTHRQQQHTNGFQHQHQRSSSSQSGLAHSGRVNPWQEGASQHQQQDRLLHHCSPGDSLHPDKQRRQHAHLLPAHQSAHSQQQDSQTMVAAHSRQQQPPMVQPAAQLPVGSFKGFAQHSMQSSAGNHAKMYKQQVLAKGSATNSLQEQASRPAWNAHDINCEGAPHFIELKGSNGYRMPKSNRQISVNALAQSSLGM